MEKNQEVVNAEIRQDIKYIRKTLDDLVNSISDLKGAVNTVKTMAIENKLRVDSLESEIDLKTKNIEINIMSVVNSLIDRISLVEKIIGVAITSILLGVLGAILKLVII